MNKLKAIDKLVDGLKVRLTSWTPPTRHVFMEENGNTYIAERINDPKAKLINLNYYPEYEWEVIHFK